MNHLPVIVQSEHLSDEAAAWLAQRSRLVVIAHDRSDFVGALAEAEGLVVRSYTPVNETLLAHAPKLRVVGRAGVGLDNIDVAACRRRGIEVVYTPDANAQAVVEYVFCLVSDAIRPRVTLSHPVAVDRWHRLRAETCGRRQMNELTLGILGLGRIGRRVAEVGAPFGCRVIFNDLLDIPPAAAFGASAVSVEELFEAADVLSIHIDGRASNRRFIGSRFLSRMRGDVLLVNTSRGFVVDNVELAAFMRDHPEAQAHLDVHEPEPFDQTYPLLGLPNVKLYPHLAGRTEAAMRNMGRVVHDVLAVLEGRRPRHPAPPPPQ